MATREESFKRLRAEGWSKTAAITAGLTAGSATLQSLADGSGDCVFDEYSFLVSSMPSKVTPEDFLLELATDLNKTIADGGFNAVNVFIRGGGTPKLGEIVFIDIAGPDNGSVILAELATDHFIFQTVTEPKAGTHPENGSREFGFEKLENQIKFYTRGVSRPGNIAVRLAGAGPQMIGWTRLCRGLSDTIAKRGGTPVLNSFVVFKVERPF
jgi:hypothetical protein